MHDLRAWLAGHHPVHSGGYKGALRGAFHYNNEVFRCGQCNILLALTDVGPVYGATMVVPESHKSNFPHPNVATMLNSTGWMSWKAQLRSIWTRAMRSSLWTASCTGGSRTKSGERRVIIYRYGVSWGATRYGYEYSQPLSTVRPLSAAKSYNLSRRYDRRRIQLSECQQPSSHALFQRKGAKA